MDCHFDMTNVSQYHSQSQIARVVTESWTQKNIFCPRCGNETIQQFPNNQKVADFFCPACGNQYELKSKAKNFGKKVADGAYSSLVQRISANDNPDFFFMRYSKEELCVLDFFVVPKFFFTPEIVEKRKPLSTTARRPGWVGCNILLENIPKQGKIFFIENRIPVEKSLVVRQMNRSALLSTDNIDSRGWLMDIIFCMNSIPADIFTLDEMYSFENVLQGKHPSNHNIRAKIRQQLQFIRDRGFIEFLGKGIYRKHFYV